jgi:hypothetical protein
MPVIYRSSMGSVLQISSGQESQPETYDYVEQTYGSAAAMGETPGNTGAGTGVSAAGDATAFGTDTLAAASANVSIVDGSYATVTNLDIDVFAAAQSSDGFALAATYLDVVYYGGGSYISIAQSSTTTDVECGTTTMTSSSSAALIAIEFASSYPGASCEEVSTPSPESVAQPPYELDEVAPASLPEGDSINLDGNLALFDIAVFAGGSATSAELMVDAIAVEDAMSSVVFVLDAVVFP